MVNAKEVGMAVRAQAMPGASASAKNRMGLDRKWVAVDLQLMRWRMTSSLPGAALKDFLARIYSGPLAGVELGAFPEAAFAGGHL